MKISNIVLFVLFFSLFGCQSSELEDPSTLIHFSLGEESFVKLQVLNSYDVVVATLMNGYQPAGQHAVSFSADNLAEGIYYYILEVTGESSGIHEKTIRLMVLVK